MNKLSELAALLKERNEVDNKIAQIINRPALNGYIGEYIAAHIFDIELCESANAKGIDGFFSSGNLAGKSVNVKYYGKEEHILDLNSSAIPDYYLVLTGEKSKAMSSKGQTRPFVISSVFLFDGEELIKQLEKNNVKIGVATSVKSYLWEAARIYPVQIESEIIAENRISLLSFFGKDFVIVSDEMVR